jgi:hypothetical protein
MNIFRTYFFKISFNITVPLNFVIQTSVFVFFLLRVQKIMPNSLFSIQDHS